MAPSKTSNKGGGVKGFFTRAAASFQQGFQISRDVGYWLAMKGGRIGLVLASTSMVILMPLIFEINREITVRFIILLSSCIVFSGNAASRNDRFVHTLLKDSLSLSNRLLTFLRNLFLNYSFSMIAMKTFDCNW